MATEPSLNGQQPDPLIWIVVLHYQGAEETAACLKSLCQLQYPNFKVLLMDNGSPDRSAGTVASAFPQFDYVRMENNLGFAGGCNAGVKYAEERGAKWIWLLNNDTRVDPSSLSHLVEHGEKLPKAGLVGAQVFTPDGDGFVPSGGGEIDFVKGKTYERRVIPPNCGELSCEWISGCNLLVRLAAFQSVGGFDENYFLYFEDTDLCYRLRQTGWECFVVPSARIEHIGLRSTQGKRSTWRHYYYIRNRLLFFQKHASSMSQVPIKIAVVTHLARHSLTLPFKGETGRRRLKAELLGFRDYVQQRFGKAECLDW